MILPRSNKYTATSDFIRDRFYVLVCLMCDGLHIKIQVKKSFFFSFFCPLIGSCIQTGIIKLLKVVCHLIYLFAIVGTLYWDNLLSFEGPHFSQKLLLIILGARLTALRVSAHMHLFYVLLQSALALKCAHAVVAGEEAAPAVLSVDVALQLLLCGIGEEALVALGGLDVRGVEGGVLR